MRLWPFNRAIRNPGVAWPGSGGFTGPASILDSVFFVEDVSRLSIIQNLRFGSDSQTAATGGATTSLTHPEPPAGFFHIPVSWELTYDGAANISVDLVFVATASTPDAWGRWVSANTAWGNARVVANRPAVVIGLPYMRGQQLRATFNGPAGATNVSSTLFFIECPAECCSLDTWRAAAPNFTHNVPLP